MSDNERVDWDMHQTTFDQHCHHTQDAVGPTTSTQDVVGPTTSTQDVVGPTTSCGRSHTDGTFLSLCVFK